MILPSLRPPLPVFLISFNRGAMLLRTIEGIRKQNRKTIIIIQDNGSTDTMTLKILHNLATQGISVYYKKSIKTADDLININDVIEEFFHRNISSNYIVSDCDIDLSVAAPGAIDIYEELLERDQNIDAAGPMLRIRDIPTTYPLYNQVMNRHIAQFWWQDPIIDRCSIGEVAFIHAPFDTTLAVHRAGSSFERFRKGVRVYEPYEALHLDWYSVDTKDEVYKRTSSPLISHWNNNSYLEEHKETVLKFRYFQSIRYINGKIENDRCILS